MRYNVGTVHYSVTRKVHPCTGTGGSIQAVTTLSLTTALEGGEGSASRPGRSLPLGKTRYPLYRRLCELQDRSGQVRKISPAPEFDPRTVQPVASRYNDHSTRPTAFVLVEGIIQVFPYSRGLFLFTNFHIDIIWKSRLLHATYIWHSPYDFITHYLPPI